MNDSRTEGLSARIAARLKQAREDIGLTLAQASKGMGFENYQVLMNIEKGERAVKALELVNFARLYARQLDFFLSSSEPSPAPAVVWRSRGVDPAARRVEREFLEYCKEYGRLETFAEGAPTAFGLKSGAVSGFDDAVLLGESITRQLELGSHPAKALASVLEENGVKLMVQESRFAGSAASTVGDFGAGVFLNSTNAPWRVSYDLAHELFHLLTWGQFPSEAPGTSDEEKPMVEKLADAFASALLLPEATVVKEFRARTRSGNLGYVDCVNMARDFGVSTQALIWRLISLRLVTRESGTKAIESESLKEFDRNARQQDRRRAVVEWPTPRFIATAFKCLQLGRLSRGRFAELMQIDRGEIDGFLAQRGYNAWEDYSGEIATA
jgi:Zn-dependent peptidase ImmA (M78 family)/transcriptional regulator with XRE-family HTH domain